MRRKLVAFAVSGLLAGGIVAMNLAPAEATHTYRHLVRQINRLENQVADLQRQNKCEGWVGVTQFGGFEDEGYTYTFPGGVVDPFETALDLDGSSPQYKFVTNRC